MRMNPGTAFRFWMQGNRARYKEIALFEKEDTFMYKTSNPYTRNSKEAHLWDLGNQDIHLKGLTQELPPTHTLGLMQ